MSDPDIHGDSRVSAGFERLDNRRGPEYIQHSEPSYHRGSARKILITRSHDGLLVEHRQNRLQ
jgi:hypothetical protein